MIDRETRNEIVHTAVRLRQALDDLTVRGLSTAGEGDLKLLEAAHRELGQIGAAHLSGRLGELVETIRDGRHPVAAGSRLLRAQTSLRLFERLLTREAVTGDLEAALASSEEEP